MKAFDKNLVVECRNTFVASSGVGMMVTDKFMACGGLQGSLSVVWQYILNMYGFRTRNGVGEEIQDQRL